jgi:hypothetical protein
MLTDTVLGLAIAVFVISSIAWVSQYRRIRDRIRAKKAPRAQSPSEEVEEVID